jgi:hypothetical protein
LGSKDSEPWIKILLHLDKKPSFPKQIEDELDIHHSTVMYVLRKSLLAKNGIIIQLSDGRYALKWYDLDKDAIIRKFGQIREKLLRNPLPEEFAGPMSKTPSEARDILYRYIIGYREPTSEEIRSTEDRLFKKIVLGSWSKNSWPIDKKSLYEKGIKRIIIKGISKEILEEILAGVDPHLIGDAQKYLKNYPLMESTSLVASHDTEIHYKLNWSADARQAFRTIEPWNQTAEVRIPEKFDESLHFALEGFWDTDVFLKELSDNYVPSSRILNYLMRRLITSDRGELTFVSLKKFCQNAMEVGQLNDAIMHRMAIELIGFAFNRDFIHRHDGTKSSDEYAERNAAFEIMYVFSSLNLFA